MTILAGNCPVIYLIVTRHRLHKAANWFVLSLSLSDLLVGLLIIPVSTACGLFLTCNLSVLRLSFDLLLFVSVANMCAMTADRYHSVVRPLTYFQSMTVSRVLLWISAAWILPIASCLLPFAWIFSNSQGAQTKAATIYETLQVVTFNVIPCVVMLLVYGHLHLISRKHSRQIRAVTQSQHVARSEARNPQRMKQESSSTRVFGLVVFLFVLCWILSAYRRFCDNLCHCAVSRDMVYISRLFMLANSAMNPFIYAFLKEDIKLEVKKLVCRRQYSTENGFRHPPWFYTRGQR